MKKYSWVLPLVGFLVLEAILFAFVDRPVSDFMRDLDNDHHAFIDFFRSITDYGKSRWYLWPSAWGIGACVILTRTRFLAPQRQRIVQIGHALIFFFASIALSGIATDILKPIFGRARPVEELRDNAYGFQPFTFDAAWNGMPSGHATTAAALALVLCLLVPRARILWLGIGLLLAASRVMVNAHYLSDVLAGIAIGIATTLWMNSKRDHQGMFPLFKGIFPIDKNPPGA